MATTTIKKPDLYEQYTNLAGISDATKKNLNYYSQGYQPSQQVQDAQKYLQSVIDRKPGTYQSQYSGQIDGLSRQIMGRPEYQSQYSGQIDDLYRQIMDRPDFQYDVAQDPVYQAYRDQYMRQGQQAMQDTVGNAAALTGGYGNSWAATAGSQAYQDYLTRLNGVIPELYQQAYERYGQEGQEMRQNLAMLQGLDETAYGRYNQAGQEMRQNLSMLQGLDNTAYAQYRDTVGDWQADRAYAAQQYDADYQKEYNNWMAMLNLYAQLAQAENQNYWTEEANKPKGGGSGGARAAGIDMGQPKHGSQDTGGDAITKDVIVSLGDLAKARAQEVANSPEGKAVIQQLNALDPLARAQSNLNAMNTQKQILTGNPTLAKARAEAAIMKANPGQGATVTAAGKKVNVTPTLAATAAAAKTAAAKTTGAAAAAKITAEKALAEMLKRK